MNVAELRTLLAKHEDDAEIMVIDEAGQSSDVAPVLGESDIGEVVFVMLAAGSAVTATPNDIEERIAAASASETKAWSELRRAKAELRAVADVALSVYRAWDLDMPYVNKMFALGRALRDAGYQLRPGHQVSTRQESER